MGCFLGNRLVAARSCWIVTLWREPYFLEMKGISLSSISILWHCFLSCSQYFSIKMIYSIWRDHKKNMHFITIGSKIGFTVWLFMIRWHHNLYTLWLLIADPFKRTFSSILTWKTARWNLSILLHMCLQTEKMSFSSEVKALYWKFLDLLVGLGNRSMLHHCHDETLYHLRFWISLNNEMA